MQLYESQEPLASSRCSRDSLVPNAAVGGYGHEVSGVSCVTTGGHHIKRDAVQLRTELAGLP